MKNLKFAAISFLLVSGAIHAQGIEVTIDTKAARAVLDALGKPTLTREEAARIARMPQNQGPIRKLHEFHIPVTVDDLSEAIFDAAHGQRTTRREVAAFQLDLITSKLPVLQSLLNRAEADPASFQAVIQKRIEAYAPAKASLHLQGYVVAVGDGGGYAFDSTDFYLNLVMVDDFAMAKSVTTHEMYHAVQGAFTAQRAWPHAGSCAAVGELFDTVYREGSAVEASDVSLVATFSTPNGLRQKVDMADGAKHPEISASLLEMSVVSLEASPPVPFEDVYAIGYFGHAILYNVAYAMARGIAEVDGPKALGAFAKQPASSFFRRYTQLPAYGKDDRHPRLGPHTIDAIARLEKGCS